ncbi:MAG: DUF177 domain-containing protein [Dehalococcoidia bacterium]|nr:DUF177 domain-containing protein [Dehalococcoidia bacterium]
MLDVAAVEFNVAQLLQESTGATRRYEGLREEVAVIDGGEQVPVEGDVTLTRTPGGVLAAARLQLLVGEDCARCLTPFEAPLRVTIEEIYHPTIDIVNGQRLPAPEDPEAFLIDEHHILDLTEPIRQYRLMAGSLAPLCRPDCRGLCAVCGADLNDSAEQHQHERPIDARWSALNELQTQPSKE